MKPPKIECIVCKKTPLKDGVSLFRQGKFWRCKKHCIASIPKDTLELVNIIETGLKRA